MMINDDVIQFAMSVLLMRPYQFYLWSQHNPMTEPRRHEALPITRGSKRRADLPPKFRTPSYGSYNDLKRGVR
jgi:hypothetical protein